MRCGAGIVSRCLAALSHAIFLHGSASKISSTLKITEFRGSAPTAPMQKAPTGCFLHRGKRILIVGERDIVLAGVMRLHESGKTFGIPLW